VLPPNQYPQSLDVRPDGKVAVLTRNPDESTNTCASERVSWLSPAEPWLHELPALPCQTGVRIGADRVLFEAGSPRRRSLQAVGLDGSSPRALARFGAVRDSGFDSDGGRAAFALRTCGGGQAIYSLALSEKTFSAGSERCPAGFEGVRLGAARAQGPASEAHPDRPRPAAPPRRARSHRDGHGHRPRPAHPHRPPRRPPQRRLGPRPGP
jgi:hypothetical protein